MIKVKERRVFAAPRLNAGYCLLHGLTKFYAIQQIGAGA